MMLAWTHYFVYRDFEFKRDQLLRLADNAEELNLRDGFLPGGQGGADLFIERILYSLGLDAILIVAITDYVLIESKRGEVIGRAVAALGLDETTMVRVGEVPAKRVRKRKKRRRK